MSLAFQPSPLPSWQSQAACRGLDAEIFHPVDDSQIQLAKSICAMCPIAEQCLEHAIVAREKHGVWGGTTERERRSIIRRRRRAAAKARASL
jgi:WhiB family redox-sensing transcriptional regulator